MKIKTISKFNIQNKTVLVRVDYNVPLKKSGQKLKVADYTRILESLPTIKLLLRNNNRLVLISHLGRPNGQKQAEFSLEPVADALSRLLKQPINFITADLNKNLKTVKQQIAQAPISLLENIRFYSEEEKNSAQFAKKLASLGEIFVMDAFATVHRAHASTAALAAYLPAYGGLLLEKEIKALDQALGRHPRPAVAIMGGVKISDKIKLIENLLKHSNHLLIGGALANTFLAAQGLNVEQSKYEKNSLAIAKKLLRNKEKIILPTDFVWQNKKGQRAILDIGPKTIKEFIRQIKQAKFILWNGPLGYFENPKYAIGTLAVAKAVLNSQAQVIIGGGDTLSAIAKLTKRPKKNIFISTGGGAMLEFLSGKSLPGLAKLLIKN